MSRTWIAIALACVLQMLTTNPANASDAEIAKEEGWLKISVDGREYRLAAHIFRPSGVGPFPLVVINHGTPISFVETRKQTVGFSAAATWFAEQGFVAVVALRPGFGESDGPYLEPSGPCSDRDYVREARETAVVESAIVQASAKLSGVDPRNVVVVGQSAGGFGAIALGDLPPSGVVGIVSFAGGRGGDDHERICGGVERLAQAAGKLGKANQVPQLWLYAANDHFFPPRMARILLDAYRAGSKPSVRFVELPPFDGDGHKTFGRADPSVWAGPVEKFLTEVIQPREGRQATP